MNDQTNSIAIIPIQKLFKIVSFWKKMNDKMEIPLESILASCYPTAYENFKKQLTFQYIQGFKDGQKQKEEELNEAKGSNC